MAEVQPVPIRRPPSKNWLPSVGWACLIALAVVVLKPWGQPGTEVAQPTATNPAAAQPSPGLPGFRPTPRTNPSGYNPRLFGDREPAPAWELWPAGYVVQFGFAGPLPVHGQPGSSASPPAPPASAAPDASAPHGPGRSSEPSAVPSPATAPASPAPGEPGEHVVDLGPTNHLIALGINTPLEVQVVEVALWLADEGEPCCSRRVEILQLPTPWEARHFVAIGVVDPADPLVPGEWPVGEYRLDLVTASGEVRSVRLRVTAPLD